MVCYHPRLPGGIPPSSAQRVNTEIWRGVKKLPLGQKDFLSEAEKGTIGADLEDPMWWGLSVWINEQQADQGRGLFRYMERWHVARGVPSIHDSGMILGTPRPNNPDHHTWWKPTDYDAVPDFQIALSPLR